MNYNEQNTQLTKLNLQSGLDNSNVSMFNSLIRSLFIDKNILVKGQEVSDFLSNESGKKNLYINIERKNNKANRAKGKQVVNWERVHGTSLNYSCNFSLFEMIRK